MVNLTFGTLYHGAGIQMAWDGAGVYYKPLWIFDDNFQFTSEVGVHFEKSQPRFERNGFYNYQNIFLDLSGGCRHNLFSYQYTRPFRLILMANIGGMSDVQSFAKENISGNWMIKYMLGSGIQFYNGRTLNEIAIQFSYSHAIESQASLMFSFYWN